VIGAKGAVNEGLDSSLDRREIRNYLLLPIQVSGGYRNRNGKGAPDYLIRVIEQGAIDNSDVIHVNGVH
jgi:hypothetical protein